MSKPINWKKITEPLDLTKMRMSNNYVSEWKSYQRTENGIEFQAIMADDRLVNIKVEVIKTDIIRFRASLKDIQDQPSDMLVNSNWESIPFTIQHQTNLVSLRTSRLVLEVQKSPWQVRIYDLERPLEPFFKQRIDSRSYGPNFEVLPLGFDEDFSGNISARESIEVSPGENFYGFGEKFTSLNKWGQEIISWAVDSGNVTSHRSYKNVPFFLSSAGYGLFLHTSYPAVFKLGTESSVTYSMQTADPELDYFVIYGPSFKHILKGYCDLTGYAPIPPKWSFGFWISRCMYQNREEVEGVINGFRDKDFPCDALNIDPMWMGEGPWCSLRWDRERFPNPDEMIRGLNDQGVHLCLWITPYIPKDTTLYREGMDQGYFLRDENGDISPAQEAFGGGSLATIDFTNPAETTWYLDKLERLIDQGVSVFKTDFAEQAPVDAVYSDGRSGLEMHNVYPLLYNKAVFELTKRKFGRGITWGRSGYAGSQRYPVGWGGDSYASYGELTGQIRGLLGYGLSGVPFCSHDVGGFDFSPHAFDHIRAISLENADIMLGSKLAEYPRDPGLYVRWLQFGVFSSHIRAHGKGPHEPWEYGPEAEEIARSYLKLRYRLLPYIYSEAVRSSQTGLPMVRPLVLDYQDDKNTLAIEMQYSFGEQFLVAPITSPQGFHNVYLPEGVWINYWTKTIINGGKWFDIQVPLEILPLWVKQGAIIPMGPEMDYVSQKNLDPLTVEIYFPLAEGHFTIYDEDQKPIEIRYSSDNQGLSVYFDPTPGQVELVIYGCEWENAKFQQEDLEVKRINGGIWVQINGQHGGKVCFE